MNEPLACKSAVGVRFLPGTTLIPIIKPLVVSAAPYVKLAASKSGPAPIANRSPGVLRVGGVGHHRATAAASQTLWASAHDLFALRPGRHLLFASDRVPVAPAVA